MDLTTAIEAFNKSSSPQISFFTARDGSCIANLPRVDREIIVGDAQFSDRKVTAEDYRVHQTRACRDVPTR
jgi:hypothetical protein